MNRTLENELSNIRSVVALNQVNESNSWKRAFQRSISRCPVPSKWIELLKMSFPTLDQSLPWTKKTNRTLENELSNIRSVVALNQENESNSWKWAFQHSISRCPEPRKRIELLKMSFLTFDQLLPWTKKTNRTLENELSNARSVVALKSLPWTKKTNRTLENELSNIRWFRATTDRVLESSFSRVRFVFFSRCPEPRKRIELLKMSFPTFDQSLPWTKKTNRTLENELSNTRSVVALNQENESNIWKWAFQHLISRNARSVVALNQENESNSWKLSFPTLDQSLPWTKKTNRTLENELSNIRSVVSLNQENESNSWKRAFQHSMVQGNDWSSVGKLIFKSSIHFLQSLPWTKKTNRTLENELSNARSVIALNQENESNSWKRAFQHSITRCLEVVALNQENESNSWKWAFQRSISRCPEPRKWIELLKMSFPTLDQSLPWTKKTNRTLENELSNIRWFRATTDRMLESSFSRVRFVYLVQGNDWSNVGKLIFKSSIRFLGSGQRLIECWKAHFQEFDSFSWFRATTDRMLESSFSRVRFVFLVQGNDWSNVGKLIFKSSIRFFGSEQRLIECWKARFQEFDSFSWFRATTDRMLESSFSRVRFVFLVQGNDWSSVGKLIFKSSIRFLGSGQRLIERWKAHFQEFDSFSWFRATTDRALESSFSRVRFVFLVQGNDWSNVGKLIFKSSIHLLGSGQRLIECWKARFQEFDSFSWFRARTDRMLESSFSRVRFVFLVQGNDWSNVGKLIFKSSIRFLGSGQRLIECWKARFQEFDSFSSVVALNQENESNSWKWAFQHSISRCPEPRKRIELLKTSFPTFDQSLPWTKKTNRTLENELSNIWSVVTLDGSGQRLIECWKARFQEFDSFTWFRATTDRMLESSFSRVRFVFLVQGNDWSNVGKLIFKSSIRFLGSGQRLIECWKAHFQEFDSFSWFRATTDRALESSFSRVRFVFLVQGNDFKATSDRALKSSFSRVRFVFLVQGNDWSSVGKLIFKSSIRFLQSLPWTKKTNRTLENELFNARSLVALKSLPWTKKTNRTLENELSNARSVVALNQENESNSWKWAFQRSISRCPEPRKRIELLKTSFPTLDQSLPWTKKTNRTLENELSNARSVVALNQENESNTWKWAFNIRWFRATTDRMLESSFSRVRFVFLVQGKDWSNVGKLIFKSSIRLLGSGQRLIECWKAHFKSSIRFLGSGQRLIECWKARFQEFDSFSWFRATTDRMLESSFSRVRFVFLVQSNDWSNVGKLVFKSSIRFLGSGQRLIECWKAHFQEFDSFSSVVALNQENESNSWKRAFQHSISRCSEPRKRIELLKMSFPTFDQSLPWTKKTNRTLENELSNIRSVVALNQENESNSWKWAFQHSISCCPEPRKRIELLKMSFSPPHARSVVALNQENESNSWKRAFQRSMVQGNDWSNVGKLIFKSSIHFLGSGQRLIECWKARFQEFDSFSWFRATTDRMLESSFSRVRFVFLVQGNDWSSVGKLIFKSSIRFLGSGQRLIERCKAHFQEFDSFSWFRARTDRALESSFSRVRFVFLVQGNDFKATTDRALESSFSRVRFVFLVQGNDWSNVGKLVFKSSIRFLGSGQGLIECWKARFQEFDSFSWFRATTDRVLESSFSRVRFVFLVQGNDWSSVGKLIFKSSIRFLQSLPWTKKTNRTLENELSNTRSVVALNQENESNSWKWAFQRSISRCPEPRKRIELLKTSFSTLDHSLPWSRCPEPRKRIELLRMSFPTLDQSLPWTKKTNRTLENELSNARSVVALNQVNESNTWKWAFQHSISRCPEPRKRIELLKMSFPTFDQSLPWTKKTNRTLENELSNIRSVVALNQVNESNSWKRAFQRSISPCPEPRKRIELLKTIFPTFDQSLPWTKKTNRTLENELSNIRWVVALNQENESNSWKRAFQHSMVQGNDWSSVGKLNFKNSIRFLGSGQRLIECWKAHFQEFDSFSWFRATTDRALESSFSRVRFVFLVQGNDWSSVGKLIFKSSIRFLGSGQRLIECWKARFQEFDSFSWFKATTDRALESSFSRVRFVFLVQGNDWSNVGKLIFKSSIHLLGSGQRLIECWKARFQEFDSFTWFRATTDRVLESSFSRVRFVFFSRCPEPSKRIELLKTSFPTLDQSLPWTKKTNRTLENELSNTRSVVALNQENESNSWKWAFQRSISHCPEPRKRIELLKMSFPTLDQSLPWSCCPEPRKRIELRWKARFQEFDSFPSVVALNQENESNSWKWAFQHSISRCPEPRKRIELLKTSFPTLDQSLPWTKKTNRTLENELSNIRWFRATTDRMLESSFSRVRFVFLVQGKDWSSVGKLIFKSSIRFLGSGQRLIERWKAHFQEFDSFSWFRATTDQMLESSFSRVRFVFLVQGKDWSNVGKLVFKSSIRFLGSGQRLIECWKARFQEFDSFPWFRATTDRMLESSFSRVRFVYLVQGNDWSSVGKLVFKSSIRFLQSLPWTK